MVPKYKKGPKSKCLQSEFKNRIGGIVLSSSYVHIQYSIYCKKWFQKMNPPLLSSSNSRYCKTSASSALPFQSGKYEDCHEQSTLLYFMTRQILIIIFAPGACIGGPVSVHFFHHSIHFNTWNTSAKLWPMLLNIRDLAGTGVSNFR